MARQVLWLTEAAEDLDGIAAYIARDSQVYASSIVRQIMDAARSLGELSARGRIVPEVSKTNVRELIIGNYRLIYRLSAREIRIIAVIHGARDLPRLTPKRRWARG